MTVESQVKQALANAKSLQANFETFAQQTQDEAARENYANAAKQMEAVIDGLETRLEQIVQEEPSFRMNSVDRKPL